MSAAAVQQLDWDSGHFGMPVGIIAPAVATPDDLHQTLVSAQEDGLRLVYWLSNNVFVPNPATLARFGGQRIVGYCRYRRPITDLDRHRAADPRCGSVSGTGPDRTVLDLAVLAGQFSRFRLDTRLPVGRFVAMYELWIRRSLSRELADDILVSRDADGQSPRSPDVPGAGRHRPGSTDQYESGGAGTRRWFGNVGGSPSPHRLDRGRSCCRLDANGEPGFVSPLREIRLLRRVPGEPLPFPDDLTTGPSCSQTCLRTISQPCTCPS